MTRADRNHVVTDEDVLGLYITVNHVLLVAVVHCSSNAADVGSGATLAESLALQQFSVDFSLRRVLQNHVDALVIEEVAVHAKDVLVTQVCLNLDLAPDLLLDAALLELALLDDLNGHDVLGFNFTREVHSTYPSDARSRSPPKRPFPIFFPISKSANAHFLTVTITNCKPLLGVAKSLELKLQLLNLGRRQVRLHVLLLWIIREWTRKLQPPLCQNLLFSP